MKGKSYSLWAPLLAILLISGCSTDNEENNTTKIVNSVQDEALAYGLFEDLSQQALVASNQEETNLSSQNKTETIGDTYPKATIELEKWSPLTYSLVYDFGPENIKCLDGKFRRGKILVDVIGQYTKATSERVITTQKYFVNDYKIDGTKTIRNEGTNDTNQPTFHVTIEDGVITTPQANQLTFEYSATRTWTKGSDTPLNLTDDQYAIVATSKGTTQKGSTYEKQVENYDPLVWNAGCPFPQTGTLNIKVGDFPMATINYGYPEEEENAEGSEDLKSTTSCDNEAVLNINNLVFPFKLSAH